MTVTTNVSRIRYTGDGVTTTFSVPYYFLLPTDLTLFENDVVVVGGYSVLGAGVESGGSVTFDTAPGVGVIVDIIRDPDSLQQTKLPPNDPFPSKSVETAVDKLTMLVQRIFDRLVRIIQFPDTDTSSSGTLPIPGDRANHIFGFDALGNPFMVPNPSSIGAGDRTPFTKVSGVDFNPGDTTITLPATPGSPGNLSINFDGVPQDFNQWSVLGNVVTFAFPIPAYVGKIWGYVGTTLSTQIPPDRSVNDNKLTWGPSLTRAVDSLAALRQLAGTLYSRVDAFGHSSVWDGGGGSYYQDFGDTTSADNNGTVVVGNDGTRWKLRHFGAVSTLQFGVKADNVTDDYAALANAFASGPTGVRDLLMPAGHTFSSKTLNLCNLAQIGFPLRIVGAGMLRDDGGDTAGTVLRIEPGAGKNCVEQLGSQFITWQDVKIVSTGPNGASAGIVVTRTAQADFAQNNAFQRVMVIMDRPGSNCFYNNCAEQADIRGCWFEGPRPFIWALAAEGAPATQYAAINNATFSNTCHSVDNNTFVATDGPGMWLIGVGTLNGGGNLIKKAGGNTYPHGILLQSSGAGYQSNFNMRFHAQVEDFDHAARLEGQTFGVQLDLSLSNIQSHAFSLGPASVHYSPRLAANLLNTPGAFNAVSADPSGANIFGGQFTIPPNAIQVDTNLGLRGTDVDATNHDTSNPAVFSVAAGSSFTVRGQNTHIRAKAAWNPGTVATGGPSTPFDLAVPGAAIGDRVDVTWPYAAKGCQVYGSVDTAGQVRLVIINITGSPVTFGAGTFPITVSRQPFAN